jgi:hypothetical protein
MGRQALHSMGTEEPLEAGSRIGSLDTRDMVASSWALGQLEKKYSVNDSNCCVAEVAKGTHRCSIKFAVFISFVASELNFAML